MVVFAVLLCSVSLGGASAPSVKDGTRYRPGALPHQALLILPLATSSELRDDRRGIVLRNDSLIRSYKAMCEKTRELLGGPRVQCAYDQTAVRGLPELRAPQAFGGRIPDCVCAGVG